MKKLVIYDSNSGKTKEIAKRLCGDCLHYSEVVNFIDYDLVVFICPTYGDEELSFGMENFLLRIDDKKYFAVCETGNYYGFDDFSFGSRKLIENWLISLGWVNIGGYSFDSHDPIFWDGFNNWCKNINERS